MKNYLDGFIFPISKNHLPEYKKAATSIAEIWKEHGALAYHEFVGDDLQFDGTRSFIPMLNAKEDEVIVFGWILFESKEKRNQAHELTRNDPRMNDLVAPLIDPANIIFDAQRMAFGGFIPLVQSS